MQVKRGKDWLAVSTSDYLTVSTNYLLPVSTHEDLLPPYLMLIHMWIWLTGVLLRRLGTGASSSREDSPVEQCKQEAQGSQVKQHHTASASAASNMLMYSGAFSNRYGVVSWE